MSGAKCRRLVTWDTRDSILIQWSDTSPTRGHVSTGLASSIRAEGFEGVRGAEISLVLYPNSKCLLLNRDSLSLNLTIYSF